MSSSGNNFQAASQTPSRAHQFYGAIAFGHTHSQELDSLYNLAHEWDKSKALNKQDIERTKKRRSKFSQERNRGVKRKAFSCFESVVESLENVKSKWRCVYCNIVVEINNKTNQVKCPQCQAKHLEAPRRPTEGLLPAR